MKVVITNLKAPWPAGARLGDVVEVGDAVPGCLVGKCKPADQAAEAAHTYSPTLPAPVLAETRLEPHAGLAGELADARAALLATVAELEAERQITAGLRTKLADAEAALLATKPAAPPAAGKGGKG
jgi:hypothetical protein